MRPVEIALPQPVASSFPPTSFSFFSFFSFCSLLSLTHARTCASFPSSFPLSSARLATARVKTELTTRARASSTLSVRTSTTTYFILVHQLTFIYLKITYKHVFISFHLTTQGWVDLRLTPSYSPSVLEILTILVPSMFRVQPRQYRVSALASRSSRCETGPLQQVHFDRMEMSIVRDWLSSLRATEASPSLVDSQGRQLTQLRLQRLLKLRQGMRGGRICALVRWTRPIPHVLCSGLARGSM